VQTEIPEVPGIVEGSLVRFDYSNATERKIALLYRQHEVWWAVQGDDDGVREAGAVRGVQCAGDECSRREMDGLIGPYRTFNNA